MRKLSVVFICLVIVFLFVSCNSNVSFTETDNKTIVANDGTEYTFVGNEGTVWCFGKWEFIGHVKGEIEEFNHLFSIVQTGMYSVNGSQDVLVRYYPYNEFGAMYVKSDLLKTEVSLENCIRFVLVEGSLFSNTEIPSAPKGITECEQFLSDIRSGQTATEAGLYDLVKQPDGTWKNLYAYGSVCGVLQEDINLIIPLTVMSFDDKAYSIRIEDKEYVLPEEWLEELFSE